MRVHPRDRCGAAIFQSPANARVRRHHLGHCISGAEAFAQQTERPIGHARLCATTRLLERTYGPITKKRGYETCRKNAAKRDGIITVSRHVRKLLVRAFARCSHPRLCALAPRKHSAMHHGSCGARLRAWAFAFALAHANSIARVRFRGVASSKVSANPRGQRTRATSLPKTLSSFSATMLPLCAGRAGWRSLCSTRYRRRNARSRARCCSACASAKANARAPQSCAARPMVHC